MKTKKKEFSNARNVKRKVNHYTFVPLVMSLIKNLKNVTVVINAKKSAVMIYEISRTY